MDIKQITPIEIKPFFQSLSEKEITDKNLLTEFLLKQVGIGFRDKDFSIQSGEYIPTKGMRIKIWPDELAKLLIFLYKHKGEINTFLEFGTGRGGSFFVVDSYLRTINPAMGKSITIDKAKNEPWGFDAYKSLYPVEFLHMDTQRFIVDNFYDLCFIDADHKYKPVKQDYEKIKDHCKFIVFHDICTVNQKNPNKPCVKDLWKELHAKNKIEIITDDPRIHFMSGIGILEC